MRIIVIGLILILLIVYIWYYKYTHHKVEEFDESNISIDCVIARYNESISWINMPLFYNVNRFIVYNKGKPLPFQLPYYVIEKNIYNVGKCDHTFLYHIVTNYNNLADITLFVSGRADDPRKGPKICKTMNLVNKTHNTVIIGKYVKVPDSIYNFTLDNYLSSNKENQINEGSIEEMELANIRPFGAWFNHHWPNKTVDLVNYQSIFAIHKKHILQHSKSYYEELLEELSHDVNPEVGHYMERSWVMVFSPLPKNCLYYI